MVNIIKNRVLARILVVVLIFSCLANLFGCNDSGYKIFEQLKGIDHYSFEYPSGYKLALNHAYSAPQAVNGVRLVGKLADGSEIVLGVNISNYSSEYTDVKQAVDRLLSVSGRELLERSSSFVSGEPCEIVTLYTETTSNLTSKFEKTALFSHNNRKWDFYVYSERDKSEQVNATFEHLFNTFVLLS